MDLEKILAKWREICYTKDSLNLRNLLSECKINLPKKRFRKIIVGVSLASFLFGIGYGGYNLFAGGSQGLESYLPKGFKSLGLDMDYQKVQKLRPFIKSKGEEGEAEEHLAFSTKLNFVQLFFGESSSKDSYARSHPKDSVNMQLKNQTNKFHIAAVFYKFNHNNQLGEIRFEFHGRDCNSYALYKDFDAKARQRFGIPTRSRDYFSQWEKGKVQMSLFTSGDTYHCRLYYTLEKKKELPENPGK